MFSPEVPFATRVDLVLPSMLPSEITVVEFIKKRPEVVPESKAQDLADAVGVARSTVIRTCQTLGYAGYAQLRVALAREYVSRDDSAATPVAGSHGFVQARMNEFGLAAKTIASALTDEQLDAVVASLVGARRIVCTANGFSTAVTMDFSMRLAAMGLAGEFVADYVAQQFTAAQLTAEDVCFVVSASGQNEATLRVAEIARNAGATVIALCSFPRSPLAAIAHSTLIAVPQRESFRNELEHTSRLAHVALAEALIALILRELGEEEVARRRGRLIPVIGSNLVD